MYNGLPYLRVALIHIVDCNLGCRANDEEKKDQIKVVHPSE